MVVYITIKHQLSLKISQTSIERLGLRGKRRIKWRDTKKENKEGKQRRKTKKENKEGEILMDKKHIVRQYN